MNNFANIFKFLNNNFIAIYSELFLIIALSLFILFLVILDYFFSYKFTLISISFKIFILILFLMLILTNNNDSNFFVFEYLLIQDNFSIFIKNILIISMIFCVLLSYNYIIVERFFHYEYFVLLGLSLLGMLTMVSTNDLLTLYLAIELQSLAFYILATFKMYNNFSTEAGLKYFILGAFSSGLLLFGCSLIYGFCGTTNFYDLQLLFLETKILNDIFWGLLLGCIFLTIGILFKLGSAPFHMWLPDVYEGVPTVVTAIFAIIPKIAIFTLLLRLSNSLFYSNFFFWNQILIYSAVLSIIVGTLGALYQTKIKRLIAYSAISHVGFLLIGFSNIAALNLFSMFFYIIIYIIISLNIFGIILSIRKLDNKLKFKKINEFIILFKSNKILALNFCIVLFSIAGIPPLLGFYSKFYIFVTVIQTNIYFLAIIISILSVIAAMYYIRLIKLMFFKNFNYWTFMYEIPKINSLLMSTIFFFNIYFFFYPELVVLVVYNNILELFC